MERSRVLVLGDANVDLVIPLHNQSVVSLDPRESPLELHGGGTAANTAAALACLGEDVAFIGTIGDDGYGRRVLEEFMTDGVDTSCLYLVQNAYTSMVLAIIHPDGERDLFVWPDSGGGHTQLNPDSITPEIFENSAWLHTTGLCLREEPVRTAQLKAMRLAKGGGLTVSLDLNLRLESWGMDQKLNTAFDQALALSDVVFGNGVDEIIPYTKQASILDGAKALTAGTRTVIARLGAEGALAVTPEVEFTSPAFSVEVVDTIGAGDAFNGGFISAKLAGKTLQESVRWGNAAAALKIGKTGARGLPTRTTLLEFLGE